MPGYPVPVRKKPTPNITPEDSALFREAIGANRGDVRGLAAIPAPPVRPRPRPSTRMAQRDDAAARLELQQTPLSALACGDALNYRRDELPKTVLTKLARGSYTAQEELDLHGLTARHAEATLRAFLRDCQLHGVACVRIIHGKGQNSDDRLPVLKNLVDRILRQRADVLAFHSAPPAQGGTGAVLVLLAKR